jgi:hypothetical protein
VRGLNELLEALVEFSTTCASVYNTHEIVLQKKDATNFISLAFSKCSYLKSKISCTCLSK